MKKKIIKGIAICLLLLQTVCLAKAEINIEYERYDYSGMQSLAYNGETYVLVGAGLILCSSDLENWEAILCQLGTETSVCGFQKIIWNGKRFVACYELDQKNYLATSPDGREWKNEAVMAGAEFSLIGSGKSDPEEIFLKTKEKELIAQNDTEYYKTADFVTFEPVWMPECNHIQWQDGKYVSTLYEITESGTVNKTRTQLNISEDGVNWSGTTGKTELDYIQQPMFYRNGKVYAQNGSNLFTSEDFVTWTPACPKTKDGMMYTAFPVGSRIYISYEEFTKIQEEPVNYGIDKYYKYSDDGETWIDCEPFEKQYISNQFIDGDSYVIGVNHGSSVRSIFYMDTEGNRKARKIPSYKDGDTDVPEGVWKMKCGYLQEFNGVKISTGRPSQHGILDNVVITNDDIEAIDEFTSCQAQILFTGDSYLKISGFRTVDIYDLDFNLIRSFRLPHSSSISYYDGVYYRSESIPSFTSDIPEYVTTKSTDLETWEPWKENLPDSKGILRSQHDPKVQEKLINGESIEINFEDKTKKEYNIMGDFIIVTENTACDKVYFSYDGVYYLSFDTKRGYGRLKYVYEQGDKVVLRLASYDMKFPKDKLYSMLDSLKEEAPPYVVVKNKLLGFSTLPITEEDRTLVPMRFLFENLDAEVMWDETTQTATAVKGDTSISFCIDNHQATVNGEVKEMDVPARLVNDNTMVPLRFLSEGLGYTVNWNEETRVAEVIE